MKLRLTESDFHRLITSTINKVLNEGLNNYELLSKIVEKLSSEDVPSEIGDNYIDIPLDDNGSIIACIDYEIVDSRYLVRGEPSDPTLVDGNYKVNVVSIVIDNNGEQVQIDDNGMVENALNDLVSPSIEGLQYDDEEDDQSGYNDYWR